MRKSEYAIQGAGKISRPTDKGPVNGGKRIKKTPNPHDPGKIPAVRR